MKRVVVLAAVLAIAATSFTWGDTNESSPSRFNQTQVNGTTIVTGGPAGSQGVGGPDANNAAITGNPLLAGIEALSSQPAAATTGNLRRLVGSLDGGLYVRPFGPVIFSAGFNAIAATLTQIQAAPAAGLSLYITSIAIQTTTTTSGTYAFQSGTGANCVTATTAVFPSSGTANRFNAVITTNGMGIMNFSTPIKLTAAHALCVIGVATNTVSGQVTGFTAP